MIWDTFEMKERFAIITIAAGIGLFTTSIAFLLFKQSTSQKPPISDTNTTSSQTNTTIQDDTKNKPPEGFFIQVNEPQDESVVEKRTVVIKGKTNPGNTVIVSSNQEEAAGVPSKEGDFSLSLAIEAGMNTIITRAISPSVEEAVDQRTVSFTTDEF